jgi:hypothetical protein
MIKNHNAKDRQDKFHDYSLTPKKLLIQAQKTPPGTPKIIGDRTINSTAWSKVI